MNKPEKGKWNYESRYIGEPDEMARDATEDLPDVEVFDIEELEKTVFEEQVIDNIIESLQDVLADIGVEEIGVRKENIHILSKDEYRNKVSPDSMGKVYLGHIYMQRCEDQLVFISMLSHEISHYAGFSSINVFTERDEETGKVKHDVSQRKGGVIFSSPKGKVGFNGYGEAVTELFSKHVKEKFIQRIDFLSESEKDDLLCITFEAPSYIILDKILQIVSEDKEELALDDVGEILKDHLFGTYNYIKKAEKKIKGVARILREMGKGKEDVLRAAKQLGFDDVVKKVKELVIHGGKIKRNYNSQPDK